ncbi:MAG: hypothetical protein CO140_04580 [Candidatus Moranbacteria bacterium CG_4_9_14_3_um_filter_40_7]|nr:MAG: hypothetical protein COX31_00245 [Candidatus Moranbacteria bacterium CG23_combo_of_CG06-09_8_20_14_all_40_16]PJA87390.1 MAG: hypothetical protein CO140_04580 [Candidatus Moranbacteria bacterium CG_4_9_14_3_um_filter_40_7]
MFLLYDTATEAEICQIRENTDLSGQTRAIGRVAFSGDSLLADKPAYKMLLEKLGMLEFYSEVQHRRFQILTFFQFFS